MNKNTYRALILKIILSILCSVVFSISSFSQDDFVMKFEGKVKDGNGKIMSGATVKILQMEKK